MSRTVIRGLAVAVVAAGVAWTAPAGVARQSAIDERHVPGTWSEAHRRLFTPFGAPSGAYLVKVVPSPMSGARREVMGALGVAEPSGEVKGGPWSVKRLEVAEAFGASGPYEPTRLARLFNGKRAEVCRGPVVRDGRTVASVTLISPYPDATLSRLEPGTLVIVLRL